MQVHLKFDFMDEIVFLTINLTDRFISVVYTITRKDIQLVGFIAMVVASKYEEIWAPMVVKNNMRESSLLC